MIFIILFILLLILYIYYNSYIDIFKDYRGKYHIILWYDYKGKRKFINLLGSQK